MRKHNTVRSGRYSQNLEEDYILDYFKDYPAGTFLSIGENDGQTFSNVRALALTGRFKGVMVEPHPEANERLKKLYHGYKGFYIYPYAITKHNGKAILQASGPQATSSDVGLVSTFHAHEKARFERVVSYTPIEVKTFKWKTFLNRLSIKTFDFMSIDCEGSEMDFLPDMDLSQTKMICIEWNGKPELKVAFEKYLDGFNLIYTSAENLLYAR